MIKYTNETVSGMKYNSNKTQELSLDVLVVADFLTYQAFLEMSNGNSHKAAHDLKEYLQAVFEQMKLIYDEIKFGNDTLHMVFAGTWIATEWVPRLTINEYELKTERRIVRYGSAGLKMKRFEG